MSLLQFIKVEADQANQRLDNFLVSRLKGLPKSRLYRLVRKGDIRVNKKRTQPSYRLQADDIIKIPPIRLGDKEQTSPLRTGCSPALKNLLLTHIVFENEQLIVLNKPSGLAVHGGSGISLGVIEILREIRFGEKFLELVHRLDRDTSGCLMIAKKPAVLKALHYQLQQKKVEKCYVALVDGYWPKHLHEIDAPLKKNQLASGERMVRVDKEGKNSLTHFRVLQRFSDVTLVEARPFTGRTHQIRVHTQFAQHPIVGDEKYGNKEINKKMRSLGSKRLFLHASELKLTLPDSSPLSITAPLPQELLDLIKNLTTPRP